MRTQTNTFCFRRVLPQKRAVMLCQLRLGLVGTKYKTNVTTRLVCTLILLAMSLPAFAAEQQQPANVPQGQSMDIAAQRSQTIRKFWNSLTKDSLHLVDEFYSEDVQFADPISQIKGRTELKAYYQHMYRNVTQIHFDFHTEAVNGAHHLLTWTMRLKASGLNSGNEIIVPGMSDMEFAGDTQRVRYHRDYFDVGAMIYEHIPVIRNLLQFIKNRLHP